MFRAEFWNAPRPGSFMQRVMTPWTIVVLAPMLVLLFDQASFEPVVRKAVTAFIGTVPYIAFAVLLIASLKAAGAETSIARVFKGNQNRMIVMAAFFGGLAPFCSCEVIPFISALLALGAPLASVMAFWLSSPLIDPPTLLITAGALGWHYAVGKAVFAVMVGLLGGFSVKFLMQAGFFPNALRTGATASCGCGPSPLSGKPVWRFWSESRRRQTFQTEMLSNAVFLIKWLALAYVLEGLMINYVPADLIARVVGGNGLQPIVIAAVVGMPAYLNSYVAPPMLAGLTAQGMGAGAAMAFMISGGISSIPAMAAVWSMVKREVFTAYILFGISGAILSGLIFSAAITLLR